MRGITCFRVRHGGAAVEGRFWTLVPTQTDAFMPVLFALRTLTTQLTDFNTNRIRFVAGARTWRPTLC